MPIAVARTLRGTAAVRAAERNRELLISEAAQPRDVRFVERHLEVLLRRLVRVEQGSADALRQAPGHDTSLAHLGLDEVLRLRVRPWRLRNAEVLGAEERLLIGQNVVRGPELINTNAGHAGVRVGGGPRACPPRER